MTQKFYRFYGGVIVVTLILGIVAGFCGLMASTTEPSFAKIVMDKYVGEAADLTTFSDKVEIADNYRSVVLENRHGDITVRASTDGKTHLLVGGRAPAEKETKPYGYRVERGVLDVQVLPETSHQGKLQFSWHGVNDGSSEAQLSLVLEVPPTFRGDVDLRTVHGDLSLAGVSGEQTHLKAVNGDIKIDGASTWQHVAAETVNGDITVNSACFDDDLRSVAGDIQVNAPKGRRWNVTTKTISGDVDDSLPRGSGNLNATVQVKTVSGDINLSESSPTPAH